MTLSERNRITGQIDRIALSLSGGGVRAAGFHLGAMCILRRLGLLEKVRIISSVSGGSMPALGYSLAQRFGRSFQDFFDDFYESWPNMNLVEELFSRLSARDAPSASGRRDLIVAMANVYEDIYFRRYYGAYVEGGLTLGALMEQPRAGHLEEMIFNATEFKTGTAFRFQVSDYRCLIGNANVAVCNRHGAQIRIADIMAASSCIPGGMEPMFFPQDFRWPDDGRRGRWGKAASRPTCDAISEALARNTDTGQDSVALMDGGVYDNQGITSTLLAINRLKTKVAVPGMHECGFSLRRPDEPFRPQVYANWLLGRTALAAGGEFEPTIVTADDLDLLIISDTPVRKASFYPRVALTADGRPNVSQPPAQATKASSWLGRLTLNQLSHIGWIALAMLVVSASLELRDLLRARDLAGAGAAGYVTFELVIPLLLILLLGYALLAIKAYKRKALRFLENLIPRWREKPARYLAKLRIADLIQMTTLRAESLSSLTTTIFMNRIRELGYSAAFGRDDLRGRIIDNEIFALQDLAVDDPFNDVLKSEGAWPPSAELARIAGRSATMGTKLWIDRDAGDPLDDLDYLVAAGQATFCYNFIKYLWQEHRDGAEWIVPTSQALFEQALRDWKRLAADPVCLLREQKRESRLPELRNWTGGA